MKPVKPCSVKETLIRSLTGVLFIALILLSLLFHPIVYLVVFSLFCTGAWVELNRMFRDASSPWVRISTGAAGLLSFLLAYFVATADLGLPWLFCLVVVPAGFLIPLLLRGKSSNAPGALPNLAGMIFLLTGFTLVHFLACSLESLPGFHPRWLLFTFYLLWMHDTMAYVSGRLAGRHPVWTSVSPSKTWEGSLGGAVFTFGLAWVFGKHFESLSPWEWSGLAGLVVVFGTLGDFFESWLKRKAGVKDSGKLLPGHGGILDRLDSMLLTAPVVFIYLKIVL